MLYTFFVIAYTLTTSDFKKSPFAILELDDSTESFSIKPKIFTTFIAYLDKKRKWVSIRFPEKHFQRIINQGKVLKLLFAENLEKDPKVIKELLRRIISENFTDFSSDELKIRLVLQNDNLTFFLDSHNTSLANKKTTSLKSFQGERFLPHLKTSVTNLSRLSLAKAEENHFDDALLINSKFQITECPWANIFWVEKNRILFTTNNEILEGVTRNEIIKHFNCQFRNISLKELIIEAKEIFTAQSTGGITAVGKINNNKIGQGSIGAFTKEISDWYLAEGERWELS